MKELYKYIKEFMVKNEISCEESFYQCDWIREQSEDFMCKCWELIKEDLPSL